MLSLGLVLTCFSVILIVLVARAPLSAVTYNKLVSLSRHVYLTRMLPSFVNVSAPCSCVLLTTMLQKYTIKCAKIYNIHVCRRTKFDNAVNICT